MAIRELIVKELNKLQEKAIPEKELDEAKAQLKGKLVLSLESTSNRMSRLAKSELYYDRFITIDELIAEIDGVGANEIQKFSGDFFNNDLYSEALLIPEE